MAKEVNKTYAPIALFAYSRPHLLKQTLDSLRNNEEIAYSELFIFCDGPKLNPSADQISNINKVREIANAASWCKKLTVFESEKNLGLANSIIAGVTKLVNEYGNIIVVEDDVVLSRYFLAFMNDSLITYEKDEKVVSIGSWNYYYNPKNSTENYFIRYPDTIAWATFKRAWKLFISDPEICLAKLKETKKMNLFNVNGASTFFENTLKAQIDKKVDSWAIRWTATAILNDALSFYPRYNLAKHIGFGEGATHEKGGDNFDTGMLLSEKRVFVKRIDLIENKDALKAWKRFLVGLQKKSSTELIKSCIKKMIPHFIKKAIRNCRNPKPSHGWFGNYKTWEEAEMNCKGYQANSILEKVKTSILKVKSGESVYERDSVLFDEIQYSKPLIDAIKKSIEHETIHIVDFGGSLGSSYFQNRFVLKDIKDLKWSVVEQKHFVDCGKKEIAENALQFFYTIDEALKSQNAHVLLLSSILQYFEEPYAFIEELLSYNFEYIIIDRTAFIDSKTERITKQIVPAHIYEASYPAWFFNEEKFVRAFKKKYMLVNEFDSAFDDKEFLEDNKLVYRKGFYFKLISNEA